jgi:hypothetical protein
MNRLAAVAVAALVGVGIALVMFGSPDTGADVDDLTPRTPSTIAAAPPSAAATPPPAPTPPAARPTSVEEKQALNDARRERLAQPSVVKSSRAIVLWSGIRRQLIINGSDAARGHVQSVDDLVSKLREVRHDPEMNLDGIRTAAEKLETHLRGSDVADKEMEDLFVHLDELDF